MSKLYKKITAAVIDGDDESVVELVQQALDDGEAAIDILEEALIPGMDEVAIQFRECNIFVPEVLMSAEAMQQGNNLLKPLLTGSQAKNKGTVVMGTVKGDLHDIGKKIVGMMLEGAGFKVIDLGVDVDADSFISTIKENDAALIGMSAMLTTTMSYMAEVIQKIKEEGLNVKIMVGGAPLSEEYAKQIGGNYSFDASSAVELAKALVG